MWSKSPAASAACSVADLHRPRAGSRIVDKMRVAPSGPPVLSTNSRGKIARAGSVKAEGLPDQLPAFDLLHKSGSQAPVRGWPPLLDVHTHTSECYICVHRLQLLDFVGRSPIAIRRQPPGKR